LAEFSGDLSHGLRRGFATVAPLFRALSSFWNREQLKGFADRNYVDFSICRVTERHQVADVGRLANSLGDQVIGKQTPLFTSKPSSRPTRSTEASDLALRDSPSGRRGSETCGQLLPQKSQLDKTRQPVIPWPRPGSPEGARLLGSHDQPCQETVFGLLSVPALMEQAGQPNPRTEKLHQFHLINKWFLVHL